MSEKIFLVVGLGNPGTKYEKTRHNVGYMVVDEIARRYDFTLNMEKWDAHSAKEKLWGENICFVKPTTYMNLSGRSIAKFRNFYKIENNNILIIHDDLDMKTGRLKMVKGGGAGGHNGIRSLVGNLGTADFYRMKVGIGRPGQNSTHPDFPVEQYVLKNFEGDDKKIINERIDTIVDGLEMFFRDGVSKAMNKLNSCK